MNEYLVCLPFTVVLKKLVIHESMVFLTYDLPDLPYTMQLGVDLFSFKGAQSYFSKWKFHLHVGDLYSRGLNLKFLFKRSNRLDVRSNSINSSRLYFTV